MNRPDRPHLTLEDTSDDELDALSKVSVSDVATANVDWQARAPMAFRDLLLAAGAEEPPPEG